ncbi:importin-7 isoform X2 [Chrysoperla carnea]|uniref:importin-7 isoform X2 n=1 Tax=Chrysoperla carnea TaxID=189513 RepID=UPI001D0759A6|nr:importin-7 isoform X2 [Chrysoperla carnea]
MDSRKLIDLLKATIDPNQRQQAEEQLSQIHKIIGFAPTLLHVVMMNDLDMPIRQAAVIYLKNLVTQNWNEREPDIGQPIPFSIHEQDRSTVRDSIVEAVIHAPELIRVQLAVCVTTIVKNDFPERWTQIVDKISIFLQNPDPNLWPGALLCLFHLVKNFEFKKANERAPLNEAMNLLLPMIHQLCVRLLPDESESSVLLQKQILKIFFALTQYTLPLDLINKETFSQWMEIARCIADRPVPEACNQVDEDELPHLPWWKCKKWALHILYRMYERYGSPGNVVKEYQEFAEWYLQTFSVGILTVLLKILDQYRNKIYVAPRVLQQTLNYINQGICHSLTWKFLKPHMFAIIRDVIFPLMSYSAEDEELWNTDPHEYIRVKFDIFEDFISPITAASTLLVSCCRKRKDMLQKSMQLAMEVLSAGNAATPRQKDGALHIVGSLAERLQAKPEYRQQLDGLIAQYVFPEFASPYGHMRARACWTLQFFKLNQDANLAEAVRLATNALLTDPELPVKVEAAIALQSMLKDQQDRVQKHLEPQVKQVTLELLQIIRETENDDLTNVMQKIVGIYKDQLCPIAIEICTHLAQTFSQLLESDESTDEKAITAMGLLNTIETLAIAFGQENEILNGLEPILLQVICHILQNSVIEFYEEALNLIFEMTSWRISADMWKCLDVVFEVFQKDGFDYFTDMMPALHNYVTTDTDALLTGPDAERRVLGLFNMCRTILNGDPSEEAECHAAKLLEVMILQCGTRISNCIPSFLELVLGRLTREVKTSELRTMCLQVVIAAIYIEPTLTLQVLEKLPIPNNPGESITAHFLKQWLHDTDCFLGIHNRKICVLGLCRLLALPVEQRPAALADLAPKILPSLVLLFDGLQRAYAARARELDEESSDEDDDDEYEDVLSSDEDELDERSQEYLERLSDKINRAGNKMNLPITATIINESSGGGGGGGDTESEDDDEDYDNLDELGDDDTMMEGYTTPLDDENCVVDEYVVFKDILANMQVQEPQWYSILASHLNELESKLLQEALVRADQRRAAIESKRIEQSGGYNFTPQAVPTSFKFGGTPIGQ